MSEMRVDAQLLAEEWRKDIDSRDTKIAELTTRIQSLEATIEACRVALEWQVNGFPLREYLKVQFPATIGHIPIDLHLDKLDEATRLIHESQHKGVEP